MRKAIVPMCGEDAMTTKNENEPVPNGQADRFGKAQSRKVTHSQKIMWGIAVTITFLVGATLGFSIAYLLYVQGIWPFI